MKSIKYVLVLIISVFSFNFCVLAEASNFEPFVSMPIDITENQVKVALGFAGEEIMTVKSTITYDSTYLTLVQIEALDNFNVATSQEKEDGKYRTVEVLADSDYSFNESNYAVLIFEVKNGFKNRKKTDIFLYDYTASGPDKIKFRYKGLITTLNRVSTSEMNYTMTDINSNTKRKYWLLTHAYVFVVIGVIVVFGILILFLVPSRRKKERRDKTTEDLIKSENYTPGESNIKIDKDAIEKIGKVEKQIDMSQAIIVNEDVKPFGDIVGKFDDDVKKEVPVQNVSSNVNVFDARTPDQISGNLGALTSNTNNGGMVNLNDNINQSNLRTISQSDVNGFDPFHATIIEETELPKVKEVNETKLEVQPNQNNANNDGLTVINPQIFETIEMPKLNEDVNIKTPEVKTSDKKDNNIDILSIIILFILVTCFSTLPVYASEYRVKDLRDCIVGRTFYDKTLDYNNDGVIDILDIIETKDLANCSFETLLSNDPGFAELHGASNNLISSDSPFVKPTKKASLIGNKTTKEKITKEKTSKNSSGGFFGLNNNKTTKEKTTRDSGSKETTERTIKTTTKKATSQTYQVNITGSNGSASPSSFELAVGNSKTVTLNSSAGYTVDTSASSCSNVAYSFNGITKLVLANITGPASCNLVFRPNSNVKMTLKYSIGSGNSATVTPSFRYTTKSIDNGGNGVYGQTWSTGLQTPKGYKLKEQPSCGSYANGVYSVTIPVSSTTCTLSFDPIMYNFSTYVAGQQQQITSGTLTRIFYNEKKKVSFESFQTYSNVSCNGGDVTRLTRSGKSPYTYSFSYTHTETHDASCTIS